MAHSPGVPRSLTAVTYGRAASVIATFAALATAAAVFGGFGAMAHTATPWIVTVQFSVVVLLAVDAWLLATRRAVAAIGTAIVAAVVAGAITAQVLALPDRVQAILSSAWPIAVVGAAWVALGWRGGERRARWMVGAPALAAAVVMLAGFDPIREPRCFQACANAPAPLAGLLSAQAALAIAAALTAGSAIAYSTVALRRGRAAAPPVVLATAGACIAAVPVSLAWRVLRWNAPPSETAPTFLPVAVALALAVGVLGAVLVESRRRAAANRLTASLTNPAWSSASRTHFAVPGERRWIDWNGVAVDEAWAGLVLEDAGMPIARLPGPGPEPIGSGAEIGASQLLALRNAQLAAVARARVSELQASRRRIVDIADAESRRIERDLHDGAQQRLVSSMLYLSVARLGEPGLGELDEAEASIRTALDELRSIAHGLSVEVLRTEGVWAAVEELVGGAPLPIELDMPSGRPGDDAAAAALYHGVAMVVERAVSAPATRLRITGREHDGVVRSVIEATGLFLSPEDGTEAADRIGALGGRFEVENSDSGTRVVMEVPCAS